MIKSIVVIEPKSIALGLAEAISETTGVNLLSYRRISSRLIEIALERNAPVSALRMAGSGIVYWDDFWLGQGLPVSPMVKSLELQNSISLQSLNIPYFRPHLTSINLSGAKNLKHLNLSKCLSLEFLDLERCHSLREISLGINLNLNQLSIRDSKLPEETLERILSGFSPANSPVEITERGITYGAYLDLRGNVVPWSNRRIASKIRMLLCNNVAVAWSNNPPEAIIPLEMYRTLEF